MSDAEEVPLTTLLSRAWTGHAIEVDNAVEAAATERIRWLSGISLPMWANGLRLIPDDGTTVAELHARAQAACNVTEVPRTALEGGDRDVNRLLDASTARRRRGAAHDPAYVAQTRRPIADPTGALPWHPMVLHRGGWPDGS